MARASTFTLLPLDRFAAIMGINPLHFNSVITTASPNRNACDDVWFQYNWQDIGKMSREDLAYAIYEAELRVSDELGYTPVPQWNENEVIPLPSPYPPELRYTTNMNLRGQPKSIETRYGHIISFGKQEKVLVESGAGIIYSDSNADGYDDLATMTVVTSVTDIEEIHVYFPEESGEDIWEIRPVDVSISGGTATITFPKYLAVDPNLWETITGNTDGKFSVNGDDNSNFLSTADVYQVRNDPSEQAIYTYNQTCGSCGTAGCTVCSSSTETGCLQLRDGMLGQVAYSRADWDADNEMFTSASFSQTIQPDRISISYRAGLQNPQTDFPMTRMRRDWERLLAYFALTLMDNQIANCDNIRRIVQRQLEDMAVSVGNKSFAITNEILNNPLGTTRAAINMWRKIRRERLEKAT